jgi:hypothetical protein
LSGAQDLPISRRYRVFDEKHSHGRDDALIPKLTEPLIHRDIRGYFQYHTSYYAPHQEFLRSLFQPVPALRCRLEAGWEQIAARGKTAVGIHIRRGDYGHDVFYLTPMEWYLRWLDEIWPTLDQPFLYVASDDLPLVTETFAKYRPATIEDFGVKLSYPEIDFFHDWYALTRCQWLAMPNSTFSFSAALYADPSIQCFRSSLVDRGFIPLNPWDEQPLLTGPEASAENFPDIPGLLNPLHKRGKNRPLRAMMRRYLPRHSVRRFAQQIASSVALARIW